MINLSLVTDGELCKNLLVDSMRVHELLIYLLNFTVSVKNMLVEEQISQAKINGHDILDELETDLLWALNNLIFSCESSEVAMQVTVQNNLF